MKQSEVDISLKHDVMMMFSLLKLPWLPKSGANLAGFIKLTSTKGQILKENSSKRVTLDVCKYMCGFMGGSA